MRLYGGKYLRNSMDSRVAARTESRDAILMDVLPNERVARVKVQGSDKYIVAHYPENWESSPVWLKPGNSVRISHTGGVRGRIELVGHGALLPTPVAGGSVSVTNSYADAVTVGLTVAPFAGLYVGVALGTLRVSGASVATSVMKLDSNAPLNGAALLGTLAACVAVGSAPAAGTYRYDLIVIGTADLVVDVVSGTASATPDIPSTPAGHLLLARVLCYPGMTEVVNSDINATWRPSFPARISMVIADDDLAWSELSTTITVSVKDQYGNAYGAAGQIYMMEFQSGNGTLAAPGGPDVSGAVTYQTGSSSVVFAYKRGGANPGDISPMLRGSMGGLSAGGFIKLRDNSGNLMV